MRTMDLRREALDCSFFAFSRGGWRINNGIPDSLMITFKVVMGGILFKHMVKRPFAEKNHFIQAFGFRRGRPGGGAQPGAPSPKRDHTSTVKKSVATGAL